MFRLFAVAVLVLLVGCGPVDEVDDSLEHLVREAPAHAVAPEVAVHALTHDAELAVHAP